MTNYEKMQASDLRYSPQAVIIIRRLREENFDFEKFETWARTQMQIGGGLVIEYLQNTDPAQITEDDSALNTQELGDKEEIVESSGAPKIGVQGIIEPTHEEIGTQTIESSGTPLNE